MRKIQAILDIIDKGLSILSKLENIDIYIIIINIFPK